MRISRRVDEVACVDHLFHPPRSIGNEDLCARLLKSSMRSICQERARRPIHGGHERGRRRDDDDRRRLHRSHPLRTALRPRTLPVSYRRRREEERREEEEEQREEEEER